MKNVIHLRKQKLKTLKKLIILAIISLTLASCGTNHSVILGCKDGFKVSKNWQDHNTSAKVIHKQRRKSM